MVVHRISTTGLGVFLLSERGIIANTTKIFRDIKLNARKPERSSRDRFTSSNCRGSGSWHLKVSHYRHLHLIARCCRVPRSSSVSTSGRSGLVRQRPWQHLSVVADITDRITSNHEVVQVLKVEVDGGGYGDKWQEMVLWWLE
ncbi:hypothetical protein J6590_070116 [Homalodisca vitripennis]|nr:hypothetical protein J6590_070116 [Homalodisca vitripennis]